LPFIGPSTLRDTLGMGVELVANPVYIVTDTRTQIGIYVAQAIDTRTKLLPVTDEIDRTSLDKYSSYRSIYLQDRNNNIHNTKLTPAF
jgi:phospholipid-binding lipoprotein MlaA